MSSVTSEPRVIARIEDVRKQLESIFTAIAPSGAIVLRKSLMDALFENPTSAWDEVRIKAEDELAIGGGATTDRLQTFKVAKRYIEALAAIVAFKMDTPLYVTHSASLKGSTAASAETAP